MNEYTPMNAALADLQKIADLRIRSDAQSIDQACTDWRKRYKTQALAVLEPHTTEQVQAIIQVCQTHKLAICPQGGNTGLVGGAVPSAEGLASKRPHVVLRTQHLREVLCIDTENLTLTASAGYTLHEIQEFAAAHGFLFPLSLASEGSCTLGGNLSTNAGGVAVLRYGNARELCLGLEFINAQGQTCGDLRGLRKNNTGYDLRHLLIGSEGTLGVITKACMKVFPTPTSRCVAWLHVQDIAAATQALGFIQQHLFNELSSFEWMNATAIELVQTHFPAKAPVHPVQGGDHVLAEFTALCGNEQLQERTNEVLSKLMETCPQVHNVAVAQHARDIDTLWALRENISEAQAQEGLNVKHDVACPVSQLPKFYHTALQNIENTGLLTRPVLFGHLGDGNLHFNISAPKDMDASVFLQKHQHTINACVHDAVLACGGTISAEHGIGQLKNHLLKQVTEASNYQTFLAIKQALDPLNILNPGKILID
jgi:FAD/FMN-containing dehydrogenase